MKYFLRKKILFWFCLILLISPTIAKDTTQKKHKIIDLPLTKARIKILSIGVTAFKGGGHPTLKGPHIAAKIQLLQNKKSKISIAKVADEFFSILAISTQRMKEEKAVVYVVTHREVTNQNSTNKKTSEGFVLFEYDRVEANRWVPRNREIPEWLKAKKEKKIVLNNGAYLFEEKRFSGNNQLFNKELLSIDIRAGQKIEGNNMAWRLIRQYAKEHLAKLRIENKHIVINIYMVPAKEGIHIRPKLFAVILKKNDNLFWIATSSYKILFKDNIPGLVLAYQPEKAYKKLIANKQELENEAKEIMKLHAKDIANNFELNVVVIQAQWSSEKFGVQVPKYGTVFNKEADGTWRIMSKKSE